MENAILQTLQFNLVMPTAFDFAVGYCSVLKTKDNIKCLVMYLVDLSLLDGNIYMQYLPSIIATAAIALSRFTFNVNSYLYSYPIISILQRNSKRITFYGVCI